MTDVKINVTRTRQGVNMGDQAAARVSEAQVHQIADALWDDMIGASRSAVRDVVRDLFVAAGIDVAS